MKRLYFLIIILLIMFSYLSGQECDVTFTSAESGLQNHTARNSVTLGPNYSYTPNGSSLTIDIQNQIVSGSVSYTGTPIDPETRTLNTSYYVGATSGSFNVNSMGGASYYIPLLLQPGVNGLNPVLSLEYSSGNNAGMVGYGWQISGLSSIARGPKTYFFDGMARGIELDTTDRFYLDGQRLVNTTSYGYSSANAQYQTDNDIFTRVTPQSTDTNGPAWFKAETKSGLIYEYGNSTSSKLTVSGYTPVLNWYVSTISDLFGNQINIKYLVDSYTLYPSEITYGQNGINKILFFYKKSTDHNIIYIKGSKIEQWLILDKITIAYNNSILKTYEFKYNYSGSYNPKSVLNEIIEYGIGTSRYNSTAITYKTPVNVGFGPLGINSSHGYITYSSKLCTGDFNGDGKADFLCIPDPSKGATWTGIRIYYGDGNDNFNTYCSANYSTVPGSGDDCRAIDIDGDGKDDFIFEKTTNGVSSFYYMLNNGTSLDAPVLIQSQSWNAITGFSGKSRRILLQENDNEISGYDYNGDGVNDIFLHDPSGNWYIRSFINSAGQKTSALNILGSGSNSNMASDVLSADFNGDGKSEIWCFTSSFVYIYSFTGTSLNLIYSLSLSTKNNIFSLGDFNADGKTDIFLYGMVKVGSTFDIPSWKIQLSTGIGFEQYEIVQKKTNLKDDYIRLGDFNADGATDLMVTSKDQSWTGTRYYISSNNGTDFYVRSDSGEGEFFNYYFADYNGDGQTDYTCTDSQASPWWNGYTISKSIANTSFLMEKIGNGLSNITKLTYTKLSQATSNVYQKGTGDIYPVKNIQCPLSVVSSVMYDNGRGSYNLIYYYYEDLKIHLQGKGFLGYKKVRATDVASNIDKEEIYSYNTNYYYPWLLRTLSKRTGTTDTIMTVKNKGSHIVLDASRKRVFPYIQSSTNVNKLTGQLVTTSYQYDNYGNKALVVKNYLDGPTETTTNIYENIVSSSKWLLGRPTSTLIQYSGNGNTINRSGSRIFNSNNNNLSEEIWYANTNNQILDKYTYTPNGSIKCKKSTANSVSRSTSYTYCSDSIRIYTITDPTSKILTYSYDTYGRLNMTTNNFTDYTETCQYDDFNRSTTSSTNTGAGATVSYSWQDPAAEPKFARYSITKTATDGSQTKFWYDKLEREIRNYSRGFSRLWIYNDKKYNLIGQIDSISDPYYYDSTPLWNRCTYDNYGRKTNLMRPSNKNSTWTYSLGTITETTGLRSYTKTYASDGTLSSATDAGGTINYTYYPDGKIKTLVAPGGITTRMYYDIAGNQNKLFDPSADTITYTYNGFRELTNQQNGRGQTTQLFYYNDGRPNQKITSAEGTTSYNFNSNKQLISINSPGGVSRSFEYDSHGRVVAVSETIPTTYPHISRFNTSYGYDSAGRLRTITHPSGIVETLNYNLAGYLYSISAGGSTRWTTTDMNARQQITSGTYGSGLNTTIGYDNYGYLTSMVTGTIQSYSYNFDPVSGNLYWRQNNKYSNLKENFTYDNLDRLDVISVDGTTTLDMAYDSNKGGITTKTDAGTMLYNTTGKPYALSSINPATNLTPENIQTITYTSFNKASTISENNFNATFTYNSDNEKAKMVVSQGNNHILTRWYPDNTFMKDSVAGMITTYTYIGGNAYTAPCVAIKQGTSAPKYYYLLRDHSGSITHISDSTNTLLYEYSYDAWGRMRNTSTWANYAPGSGPSLLTGRGYTGHEHLPWFNLINMNGRAYDPLIGQFLSPDNMVQNPEFTLNYNRYIYCFNNPLKYFDPSGYYAHPYKDYMDEHYGEGNYWYRGQAPGTRGGGGSGGGGGVGGGSTHNIWGVEPGQGENGEGLNGFYYDWYTSQYSYTSSMEGADWWDVYVNAVLPYASAFLDLEAIRQYEKEQWNKGLTASLDGGGGNPDGMVYSFSFDFAFGGGAGFEIGLVTDKNGGWQWFASGNANIGYGLSFGPNVRTIKSVPGSTFKASDYLGYSAGFSAGLFNVGGFYGGNKPQWNFTDFMDFGDTYIENGLGISKIKAPIFGAWWSNTRTKNLFGR